MSRKRPQPPVKPFKKKPNPLKAAKVTEIDYKDVAVQEQREISKAIKNAREMALLPYATSGR